MDAARSRFGCRLMERLIEHGGKAIHPVIEKLIAACPYVHHQGQYGAGNYDTGLMQHAYGNYVIAHILEHGTPQQAQDIVALVIKDFDDLATHRIGGHTVDKAVKLAEISIRLRKRQERGNQHTTAREGTPWPCLFHGPFCRSPKCQSYLQSMGRALLDRWTDDMTTLPDDETPKLPENMTDTLQEKFFEPKKVQEKGVFHGQYFEHLVEMARNRYGCTLVQTFLEQKELSGGHETCCRLFVAHNFARLYLHGTKHSKKLLEDLQPHQGFVQHLELLHRQNRIRSMQRQSPGSGQHAHDADTFDEQGHA